MKNLSAHPSRRVHERCKYCTRVVFDDEFGEGLFYVNSEDVSLGGMYLSSAIPLKVGTLIFISFHVPPHKRPIRATAEVIRRTGHAGEDGMGVRFVGLSEMAKKRLIEFLGED